MAGPLLRRLVNPEPPRKIIRFLASLPSIGERQGNFASIAAQQVNRCTSDKPDKTAEQGDRENAGHSPVRACNVRMKSDIGREPSGASGAEASNPRQNCTEPDIGVPPSDHARLTGSREYGVNLQAYSPLPRMRCMQTTSFTAMSDSFAGLNCWSTILVRVFFAKRLMSLGSGSSALLVLNCTNT
jgi:hypothetical protein